MNIKNVLMPLLLSVHHAEAELYKCCVCVYIYIYCLDEHGQMLVSKPRLSASADLTFLALAHAACLSLGLVYHKVNVTSAYL